MKRINEEINTALTVYLTACYLLKKKCWINS